MPSEASTPEQALRRDLAACYRLVAAMGWDDLLYTHISVRIPGPECHFLLNPYGLLFEQVTASSLVKIDLNGEIIGDSPYPVNKAGFVIHSAVHAARPDAECVMHLHTVASIAVSCQAEGLLPLHQDAMLIAGRLAYHDYEGVAFDLDERPRLVADLGALDFMLLRNHGALTCGRSIATAFHRMYRLERACQIQLAAQSGGGRLIMPSAEALRRTHALGASSPQTMADEILWPALLRRLEAQGSEHAR